MDAILRAAVLYLFLLIVFRIAGRRSLSDMSSFDLVLLLIISEATQQALLGDDFSVTKALLVIVALFAIDIGFSLLKGKSQRFAKVVEGVPMILVEHGRPLRGRLRRARVSEDDVLASARTLRGLDRMEQIKFAVLEVSGRITIIPEEQDIAPRARPSEPRGR